MAKLRLGVIGAGSWAVASHLPNFAQRADEVEFTAVCRKGGDLLAQIQHDWGFRVASEDYRAVLDAGIDICLVASPHGLHFEHARAALNAGAHVLCEKPFTIDSQHAWELCRLADSKGLHLLIGYGWNYLPCVREAKRMMDEVGIGEIEQSSLRMTSVTRELLANLAAYPAAAPETAPDQATWTDPRNGGGYGQAQLTHALGLALWITGLRGDAVFAFMRALMNAPVEHHDAVTIRYSNGSVGTMAGGSSHLGANDNQGQLEFRAIGALGEFAIDLGQDYVSLWRADGYGYTPSLSKGAFRYDCAGPPHALVDLALGKDVENCSPGELGARAVEILEAAYRSAVSGRVEQVSRTAEALSARDSSEPEAA